ncbi:uncharacterized protein PAC_15597 [Phialocephala subalpina]|uniref:Uncharacterized protein n=1 Tax=Phialocephala subalpina TaxID=576137 RepID=A0A1L7XL85_9HELO|nr:uncharacterized protein PAC_15597 [Phialocephala subalpina]
MLFSSAHYAQRLFFPGARNFSIVILALANQTQNDTQQRGHGAGGGGHGGDGEGSSAPPGVAVSGHQNDGDTLRASCVRLNYDSFPGNLTYRYPPIATSVVLVEIGNLRPVHIATSTLKVRSQRTTQEAEAQNVNNDGIPKTRMRTSNPLAFAVLLILLALAIFPSTVHSAAADGILYLHRDSTDILYDRHNVNSTLPKIIIYESPEGSYWTATPEQFYFKGVHEVHEVIHGINWEDLWTMIQTLEEVDRDGGV